MLKTLSRISNTEGKKCRGKTRIPLVDSLASESRRRSCIPQLYTLYQIIMTRMCFYFMSFVNIPRHYFFSVCETFHVRLMDFTSCIERFIEYEPVQCNKRKPSFFFFFNYLLFQHIRGLSNLGSYFSIFHIRKVYCHLVSFR